MRLTWIEYATGTAVEWRFNGNVTTRPVCCQRPDQQDIFENARNGLRPGSLMPCLEYPSPDSSSRGNRDVGELLRSAFAQRHRRYRHSSGGQREHEPEKAYYPIAALGRSIGRSY